jgi:hypothetical protein
MLLMAGPLLNDGINVLEETAQPVAEEGQPLDADGNPIPTPDAGSAGGGEDDQRAAASPAPADPVKDYADLLAKKVGDVNTYLDKHPDEAADVLAAEAAGKNRKGIVAGPHNTEPAGDGAGAASTEES